MFDYDLFRIALKKHREDFRWTIEKVADKAYLDESNIKKIALGWRKPRTESAVSILNAFHMSFETFFDENTAKIRDYCLNEIIKDFNKLTERDKKVFLEILKI